MDNTYEIVQNFNDIFKMLEALKEDIKANNAQQEIIAENLQKTVSLLESHLGVSLKVEE